MQPGYPGSGQDPYNPNPSDPFGQPGYGQYPSAPDPYQQPAPGQPYPEPYQNPAAFPGQPVSGQPYGDPYAQPPVSGQPYAPVSGQPYAPEYGAPGYPPAVPAYPQPGYPQSGYPQPGYGAPMGAPAKQNNTLGLLAMIFGIVGIPTFCCYIGTLFGIAGVVLGMLGLRKVAAGEANNRGMAIAGVACGAVAALLGIAWIIYAIVSPSNGYSYYYN